MQTGEDEPKVSPEEHARRARLPAAARQALEEADVRKQGARSGTLPEDESGGPSKVEPTRFGDWERKGIAYDF